MISEELFAKLLNAERGISPRPNSDRPGLCVPVGELLEMLGRLKSDQALLFDMLCDMAAVDWPNENSIELFYQLYSTRHAHYILVTTQVPRSEGVTPSACGIWRIAEWLEREIYDLFGVLFTGHPDLRRVFLEDDWVGFPLLKDYQDDFMLERPK